MLVLMTDFGLSGPYVGQMKAVLYQQAPGVPVVDLFADAPVCNPRASAYLLDAYAQQFPEGSVFLSVIDPGVGTEARRPIIIEADGRWYVGPDNGLMSLVARRASSVRCWEITWSPERLSSSFHGRDLFAPVAARLALGELPAGQLTDPTLPPWPDDLAEVVYIDHFGNAMTGIRGILLSASTAIGIGQMQLRHAATFGAVARGEAFWYVNANGLVELAVNQGRADVQLQLAVGSPVEILTSRSTAV